jgi:hypothetical protein
LLLGKEIDPLLKQAYFGILNNLSFLKILPDKTIAKAVEMTNLNFVICSLISVALIL